MNTKKQILIVDDDTDILAQMRLYVEHFGFDAITLDSREDAEEYIAEHKPDLAILDLMMEKEDSGFILSYKMKKKYPEVPIIIATSANQETGMSFGIEQQAQRNWIKADLFLEKNIRPDQLNREINKLLKV